MMSTLAGSGTLVAGGLAVSGRMAGLVGGGAASTTGGRLGTGLALARRLVPGVNAGAAAPAAGAGKLAPEKAR